MGWEGWTPPQRRSRQATPNICSVLPPPLQLTLQGTDKNSQSIGPESAEIAITLYKREKGVPADRKASCVAVGTLSALTAP
jgi:hypothetical protein